MALVWTDKKKKDAISEILSRIMEGESVRRILSLDRDHAKLPSNVEFLEWVQEDDDLAKQYARAMEWRAESMLEDTITIADYTGDDFEESINAEGEIVVKLNKDAILRARLRVEARQFYAGKMAPKKYGTKIDLTSDNKPLPEQSFNIVIDGKSLDLSGSPEIRTPKSNES